jgi:hypothetical protein
MERTMNENQGIVGYREFLVTRDGEADLLRRSLSKREAFFDELARNPVRSSVPVNRATYFRNMARRRPEPGLEPRTLWILATAKANQAERFGVGLAELLGRVREDDPARVHVTLQETYHTRMLANVVAMFGLPVSPRPPRALVRLMIHVMVSAPERWTLPLVGASEMVGCVLFRALRDTGIELFADEPAVAERIRLLYNEILADEIGHVGFIAARLDEHGRSRMRRLYARFSSILASQFSEVEALFGRAEMARRFSAFRLANEAAELPTLAFAAAQI